MYKYLLDKNKNQFYPLIDDKSIVNVNTINDVQIEELFNPMVEDILIEDEYRFSVGQSPSSASIGIECIPERAGKQAYLDVTTSNPDCCRVSYIDGNTIVLSVNRRGESTITITETNSGLSKEARVFIQSVPRLYASGSGPLYISSSILQESFDEAVYRVEVYSNSSSDQFSHWSDGSTENPREITIYEDTELKAYYKPILCKIEVTSSNNDWGTVLGGGSVRRGNRITIKAIPNSGYRFVQWSDGDTNPERYIYTSEDVMYEAVFEELNPNQAIYYTSNDGQVVWPYSSNFGVNLVYNTYTNGQGMMVFDGDVTSIGDYAFYDCSSLTSITIPNSVTSIGDEAFDGCSSLTSIVIPDSVTSIGDWAFSGCSGLTSITIPNSVTSIGDYAFYNCSGLTSITIPNSVTSIGDWAFYDCSGLTSITIPNSVTSIGDYAFYDCSSLTSITIPNSVTSIGYWEFYNCSGLTSITIPNSVTSIGDWAFYNCSGLTSITIPNSVTSIGDYAFYDCSGLTSITCEATTPPTLGSINNLSSVTVVYVPSESVNDYKIATNWTYYSSKIQPIPS